MPHNSDDRLALLGVVAPHLGNQTEAAKRLHVSQSTISKSLKRDPQKSFLHNKKYTQNVKRYYAFSNIIYLFFNTYL